MSSDITEERCKHLVNYLCGGTSIYPSGFTVNQKRRLRQQAASFTQTDGVLFYLPGGQGRKPLRRVVVSQAEKARVIHACHDGVDGGHFGRDKTLSKVKSL